MISHEMRRWLWLPCAVVVLAVYLVGFRLYQHRNWIAEPPETVLTEEQRMELKLMEGETVNINQTDPKELMRIPGVGEVLAERIYNTRLELGGFKSPEDLKKVDGIGEKLYLQVKEYVVLE